MMFEVLIVVDKDRMNQYKGALESLTKSYTKWGFILDKTFKTMIFRGNFDLLKDFNEIQRDHFDENQAFGRLFLFIIINGTPFLLERINNSPLFSLGYWMIFDVPTNLLLTHIDFHKYNSDIMLVLQGLKQIVDGSYLLSEQDLESLKNKNIIGDFTIFKCYPIGSSTLDEVWRESFL